MSLKWRKTVILAKLETTYGTDATPTGAANAIQVSEATVTPLAGEELDRGLMRETLGSSPSIPVGSHVTCEFTVEIAGSGTAGTAPAFGPLLRACAMAEVIDAGVSVAYNPISEDEESASIYFHRDGNLFKLIGARGNVTAELNSNALPVLKFSFTGLWTEPASAALPTTDFSGFIPALPVNNANTPTFSLHGYAAVMTAFTFNLGNTINHRDRVNSEEVKFSDRKMSGSATFEEPAIATKNFYALAKNATLDALQLVHGTNAGNIVTIDMPKVQLKTPSQSNEDGTVLLAVALTPTPDAGDDEITLTFT
ncbi:phage tail tube protein [Thalassospira marina]|uniref:Uncharacterized protein n=1 Tax=Thalassospira marina TaxID=2048283 RepID=A0A2N3KYA3_9PROT|nr:phage tail tube protein [Thalassospira marina]PKR55477.1 hypothetical protein COO20_04725 [Thalassospira marina]